LNNFIFISINFLKPGDKTFLDNSYTDELTGKDTITGNGVNQPKLTSVAVGYSTTNTILISNNGGFTWTGLGITIFTSQGNSVAYGNNLWIAVGQGKNTIATSTDGIKWTGLGAIIFKTGGGGIAYGSDSKWVAVGSGTNSIATFNGTTWSGKGNGIFSLGGKGIAFGNGVWIAVGQGTSHTIAKSTDNGNTWSGKGKAILTTIGNSVAYGNGVWIAVGQGTFTLAKSTNNGDTWTGITLQVKYFLFATSVVYANNLWIVVGQNGSYLYTILRSTGGGNTWIVSNDLERNGSCVTYNSIIGLWVASGIDRLGGPIIAISSDGTTWSKYKNGILPIIYGMAHKNI
jgi:hypothetical protein